MWEEARELAKEGRFDDIPAKLYIPYMKSFQLLYKEHRNRIKPMENVGLRGWQRNLLDEIHGPVNERTILWYWEETGNVGKSWMSSYLLRNEGATVLTNGKSADIAFLLDQPRIVVFDIARAGMEHVNFGIMEDIKNGRVFSPKYESRVKVFDIPHLVVFANEPCPPGKFSDDRLKTKRINKDEEYVVPVVIEEIYNESGNLQEPSEIVDDTTPPTEVNLSRVFDFSFLRDDPINPDNLRRRGGYQLDRVNAIGAPGLPQYRRDGGWNCISPGGTMHIGDTWDAAMDITDGTVRRVMVGDVIGVDGTPGIIDLTQ